MRDILFQDYSRNRLVGLIAGAIIFALTFGIPYSVFAVSVGYPIHYVTNTLAGSLADSTSYYILQAQTLNTGTLNNPLGNIVLPQDGTLTKVCLTIRVLITPGSAENVGFYYAVNEGTPVLIANTVWNTALSKNCYSVSVPVVAGDSIAFRFLTPAWATNPTGTSADVTGWIETEEIDTGGADPIPQGINAETIATVLFVSSMAMMLFFFVWTVKRFLRPKRR